MKPFSSGIAAGPIKKATGKLEEETKEENMTSHSIRTTNHMEMNFHLSNKKALYYNMLVYYEATG